MGRKIKIGDCYKGDYQPILVVDNDHPYADNCFLVSDLADRSIYMSTDEILNREYIPTLHLPISEPWFSKIAGGEKTEEYRDFFGVKKGSPINIKTLVDWQKEDWQWLLRSFVERSEFMYDQISFKPWKVLHLTNGYGHDKPQLWAHIEEISIGRGRTEWGAPADRDVFIIRLGAVFHTKSLKQ